MGAVLYGAYVVVFCELLFRVLLSVEPIGRVIKGRDDESSSRLDWVQRHRGARAFGGQYTFDVHHPIRGWAIEPGIRQLKVFDNRILNSNSKGIRGQVEYDYARPPRIQRIVILGDSYTFGDEVSDDETYSHFLERRLPHTEVLNLGVHGYGQDQMLLYLQHEGVKYQPDVVILGYVWFDMFRNLSGFSNYAKPTFELSNGGLRLRNVPVPDPEWMLDQEIHRSKTYDIAVMLFERVRWKVGWNHTRARALARGIFDELVATTRQHQAVPVFVYLPVLTEIANTQLGMTADERFLHDYCLERRIDCLFLRDRFVAAQRRGETFNMRSHWFANGHRTAADGIADYLKTKGLITAETSTIAPVPKGTFR